MIEKPANSPRFAATAEKMKPFIQALTNETALRCAAALSAATPSDAPLAAAGAAQAQFEETWTLIQSLQPAELDCGKGCSHCCWLTAETTGAEAQGIARHLETTRTPEQLRELRARVAETAKRVKGLPPEARVAARIPCSLLENGRCAAYAARPLGCRAWNSRRESACIAALQTGREDLRPVQDQRPLGIHVGVGSGLAQALAAAAIPESFDNPCELNAAMHIALSESDGENRGKTGVDEFAAARVIQGISE